jgi:hypothetical protein
LGKKFYSDIEGFLKDGKLKPNPVRILNNGLLGIEEGFQLQRSGKVSGEKLVALIKDTPGL